MEFDIIISIPSKRGRFKMKVERIYEGDSLERYRVTGGGRSIVLQTDRLLLKKTGSRKKQDWKIKEGDLMNADPKAAAEGILEICDAIEYKVETIENPPEPYVHPKNQENPYDDGDMPF